MPSVPTDQPELDDLHGLIVTWAARLIGTRDALLWLVEEDGQRLVVRYGTGRFSASVGRSLHKGSSWRLRGVGSDGSAVFPFFTITHGSDPASVFVREVGP